MNIEEIAKESTNIIEEYYANLSKLANNLRPQIVDFCNKYKMSFYAGNGVWGFSLECVDSRHRLDLDSLEYYTDLLNSHDPEDIDYLTFLLDKNLMNRRTLTCLIDDAEPLLDLLSYPICLKGFELGYFIDDFKYERF